MELRPKVSLLYMWKKSSKVKIVWLTFEMLGQEMSNRNLSNWLKSKVEATFPIL